MKCYDLFWVVVFCMPNQYVIDFMLLIPCVFLQSTNVLDKIQFMTSIKLLHVLAPGCHPQGVFYNKGIQVQHANQGIASPLFG